MREGLHKIVSLDETIVAISTPPGRGAIGIVRLSGQRALSLATPFFKTKSSLVHRRPCIGVWTDSTGQSLDEVVVTLAQSPNSYTGEDLVEISAHGNPFVLDRIVLMLRDAGARLAMPGEFTLRAVANGKMDLTQAEAVREFVDAQTERQARTALQQMEGSIAKRINPAKDAVVGLIAQMEAGIDFAEDDVQIPDDRGLAARVQEIIGSISSLRETFGYGRLLIRGASLTILGKPNVGKSSLFNCLLSAERAIVTAMPGTTRDVVSEVLDLDGIPLRLADTAGVRETSDQVEIIGVSRTLDAVSGADLLLVVLDGSSPLDADDERVLRHSQELPHVVVINKADLPQTIVLGSNGSRLLRVSAVSGQGIAELRHALREFFVDRRLDLTDDGVLTSARQYEALSRAIVSLEKALAGMGDRLPHELVLMDLYAALSALDELTGDVVTEDILDSIFSTFCIGK